MREFCWLIRFGSQLDEKNFPVYDEGTTQKQLCTDRNCIFNHDKIKPSKNGVTERKETSVQISLEKQNHCKNKLLLRDHITPN